jgi:hypothetical protein
MTIRGTNTHVFAVGDWGGLAGTLPHNSQIIQYKGATALPGECWLGEWGGWAGMQKVGEDPKDIHATASSEGSFWGFWSWR